MNKYDHVRQATQDRELTCHWPGCELQVAPAMWGCKTHWSKLPKRLRNLVWFNYTPGQEVTMTPSRRYVEVARKVQDWIAANHPGAAR